MGVFARIMMGLAEQAPDNKTISIPSHRNCVSTAGQWMQPTSKRTALGFVAQIVLKTFLPLPQTDSAYGFCLGYAKSGEAI
jgi:hypothetical protein